MLAPGRGRTVPWLAVLAGCLVLLPGPEAAAVDATGVLLLAHGGDSKWDAEVRKVAAAVERRYPTEVALGMASKRTIQEAIDRLEARDVREIVAVPLFVSSHSSVVASTEFLLGLRPEAPADLVLFAKMDHAGADHAAHAASPNAAGAPEGTRFDPMTPVKSRAPIRMARALDDDALVADILADRAGAISRNPSREVVVLVAHGPVPDDENARWLADMGRLAERIGRRTPFARIDTLTVRDDAAEPVKAAATTELRAAVSRGLAEGHRVLLVPLLISYGGIEKGIRQRLQGLEFTMSPQALLPDDRIAAWVLASVERSAPARPGSGASPAPIGRDPEALRRLAE
jgi:sirohydrochlorin ferrochelatase